MTTLDMQEADPIAVVDQPPAADTPPASSNADFDVFDLEHRDALAALEAEKIGGEKPEAPPAAAPPAEAPAAQAPAEQPAPIMIPKPRFDEALLAFKNLEAQNAFLQGQIAALQRQPSQPAAASPQPAQDEPPAPLSIKDIMSQVQTDRLVLAEQYDSGGLSLKEFTAKANELDARLINAVADQAANQQPQRADGFERHLYEQALDEIEATNPWNVVFAHQPPVLTQSLQDQAHVMLAQRHVSRDRPDYPAQHARATAYLMEQNGQVLTGFTPQQADQYARKESGGIYRGRAAAAAGGAPAGVQAQPGSQPLSPQAQARQAKLAMAAGMPPNLGTGVSAPAQPAITEADISRMNEAQLDALPQEVRAKYLPY